MAELTGHEWWVVPVTLRRWSGWTSALQAARDLYAATNPRWLRDVESHHDRGLMRLLWFSTFPPRRRRGIGRLAGGRADFEMVDRHGFAPCSPACEASDLLNDRAAHEIGGGGGNRTRSLTAYEAAAFPAGSPAVGKMARRLGAAPSSRGFGDQAAQAGARRTRCVI